MDLDGTIYLGENLIPGADKFSDYLKAKGIHHYFLSNNSSRSKADYVKKLSRLGIQTSADHILLSTDGVIEFLQDQGIENALEYCRQQSDRMVLATLMVRLNFDQFFRPVRSGKNLSLRLVFWKGFGKDRAYLKLYFEEPLDSKEE